MDYESKIRDSVSENVVKEFEITVQEAERMCEQQRMSLKELQSQEEILNEELKKIMSNKNNLKDMVNHLER